MKVVLPVAPFVVLLVVVGLELLGDRRYLVLDLVMASPLLAASLVGPRATAAYAAAAVAVAAVLGAVSNLYESDAGGGVGAQGIRLGGITLAGLLAITTSHHRVAREAALRSVSRVAEVAQRAILSDPPTMIDSVRITAAYRSAVVEAKVGGDLYEVVESPFGVRLIIGDVRGKGLDAVHLASRVLGCFRVDARRIDDLADVVADIDAEVATLGGPEDFVTAVVAQISSDGHVVLANAGHPDPIFISQAGADFVIVADRRPPLGLGLGPGPVLGAGSTSCLRLRMAPKDRLFFYTDGLAEARHPGTNEFFPVFLAAGTSFAAVSLEDGLNKLSSKLDRWIHKSLDDDIALLAVQFDPGPAPTGSKRGATGHL